MRPGTSTGSYDVDGQWWVNVHSRHRGLLALFLFTDVGEVDAPTEIIVGSHLDIPSILAPYGERGVFFEDVKKDLPESMFSRLEPSQPAMQVTCTSATLSLCSEQHGPTVVIDHESSLILRSHIRSHSRSATALMFARWSEPSFKALSRLLG